MSDRTSSGTWFASAVALALVVGAIAYSMDVPTKVVAKMSGEVVSTYPSNSKYPERVRVQVKAADGTVFMAELGGNKVSPVASYVVPEGTVVLVEVLESPVFRRRQYLAREQ